MAQKRMFDKSITNSDAFLELPDSSQILYFHLSMNADDDGFVDNWKSIIRMTGTKEDDLKLLIAKAYVIPFDTGVIVIRHWRINNYLRTDRYKETTHKQEKRLLTLGENEEYILENNLGIPMVNPVKNSIDKNSIEENIKEKINKKEKSFKKPSLEEVKAYCEERKNGIDAEKFIDYYDANGWVQGKARKPIKDWKACIRTWERDTTDKKEELDLSFLDKYEYGRWK